ncbi:hypothetical protein SAMN05444920_14914 [Nonomuraea solani]|uniref:Uncharacterized protein n=1 Tax=Nonomuraea solani TaxID=1144553 RepID=A0A1H6F4N3_9ACTN|nr:hypothetical protein [Nonomuraea solani]SEH03944.1 hypothetical protein SAMN05444920_14914 [Nonomuraea solani]
MTARSLQPDLWAVAVDEAKFALLDGTGIEYAVIGDGDDYAVRDKNRPQVEIRRPGDDFRKLGALLGRGPDLEQSAEGLHDIDVDDDRYEAVEGTGLSYAPINDHDAVSLRDQEYPGEIRSPTNDWRKLGSVL